MLVGALVTLGVHSKIGIQYTNSRVAEQIVLGIGGAILGYTIRKQVQSQLEYREDSK